MKIGLFATGYKGLKTLINLLDLDIKFVCSYGSQKIEDFCHSNKIKYIPKLDFTNKWYDKVDKAFVISWQYLLPTHEKLVILHDSYLPEFKGFGPTVSALIEGWPYLGTTAFVPVKEIDSGPIYIRKKTPITYPMKLCNAFNIVAEMNADIIKEIISKDVRPFSQTPHTEESFSIWRNEEDYKIDWNWSADKISRFVDAVGYPYPGAKTNYMENEIIIHDVKVIPDKNFIDRHAGKIWSKTNNQPEVICGTGMIKISKATYLLDPHVSVGFKKLRVKFS